MADLDGSRARILSTSAASCSVTVIAGLLTAAEDKSRSFLYHESLAEFLLATDCEPFGGVTRRIVGIRFSCIFSFDYKKLQTFLQE